MPRSIHTLVVESDFFARNWMALLFARDWRTRIVAEAETLEDAQQFLRGSLERVDALLVDTDLAPTAGQLSAFSRALDEAPSPVKVFWLGNRPDPRVFDWLPARQWSGYLLKPEIRYSLAWALAIGMDSPALTPGTHEAALERRLDLPSGTSILDGRRPVANLTEHESEVARLALVFSMERRDLADEMGISEDWGYGLVSALYKKLGLVEVLNGEVDPTDYLGASQVVNQHLREIIRQLQPAKKARDMETLAFHIMTMPEVQELP
jgi:hypothetical protein